MKIKAACTNLTKELLEILSTQDFARLVLTRIYGECLGVENPCERPAEYYMQLPDICIPTSDKPGVEVRLTGAGASGRTSKQFQEALNMLGKIFADTIHRHLKSSNSNERIQLFIAIMVDTPVEISNGYRTNIPESKPIWITKSSIGRS